MRLLDNKKFMKRLLIVAIIVIILYNIGGKKEAATFDSCNQYNSEWGAFNFGWAWEDGTTHTTGTFGDKKLKCQADDCVVTTIPLDWQLNPTVCAPYALNGWIVSSDTDCKSGCAKLIGEDLVCKECKAGEACTSKEEQIAQLLSFWQGPSCKTKYTFAIIGGGFIGLMFLLTAL